MSEKLSKDLTEMLSKFKDDAEFQQNLKIYTSIAKLQRTQFLALRKSGFTEHQALIICATKLIPDFSNYGGRNE